MRYYPIHLDLQNRRVLLVGGGTVAEGKARQLLEAGALVSIVSPSVTEGLQSLADHGRISLRAGEFVEGDLVDVILVISATNLWEVNEEVAKLARERGVWCNVVDQPDLCDFITPALVVRGELQIAISTGGGSPTLAQRVKREIATLIGEEYGELLEIATEMRADAKRYVPDFDRRRELLRAFVESEALELLRQGRRDDAVDLASRIVKGEHVNSARWSLRE